MPATYLEGVVAALRAGTLAPSGPEEWAEPAARMSALLPEGAPVLHVTPAFAESRHVVGLVVRKRRVLGVLKTPRGAWDAEGVLHEGTVLRRLHELAPDLRGTAPEAVACVTAGERRVLVETAVQGEPLSHARVRREPSSADVAIAWVRGLPETGRTDGGQALDALLEPAAARLEDLAPAGHPLLDLLAATREQTAPLRGREVPRVLEHGDPAYPNLFLLDGGRRLGVVDWELGEVSGLPGHDLVQLLAFLAFARAGVHGVADEVPVLRRDLLAEDGWARRILHDELAPTAGADLVAPLVAAAWARAALRLLGRVRTGEDTHTRERALALLESSRNVALWREAVAAAG
jgi:hypothetical protein